MTRLSSEPYYRKRRPPPNNCFERQTSKSPMTSEPRTSSEVQNLHHRHHIATRTSNMTSAGRRGLVRTYMPPDPPPIARARGALRRGERTLDDILDAQCPYHKDMRHTQRNCRDFKHSVGHGRPFHPLPPPPPRGGPGEPSQPQQPEGGGVEHSRMLTRRSTSSSEGTGRRRTEGSRSSTTDRSWRQPQMPQYLIGGRSMQ
jgi:hypothetical protein